MIGLISNRNSGHNADQFQRLSVRIDEQPGIQHIVTDTTADIPQALHRLVDQSIEVLAINGGDGTVSAILGHALEHRLFSRLPPVIVLPGGTANMNAGDVGVTGGLKKAVAKLCRWSNKQQRELKRVQRVLMRVDMDTDAIHYGMFLGAGAVMQGTEYAHRAIHSRGLRDDFSVALGAARTVWGVIRREPAFARPVALELEVPQLSYKREHHVLILAISSLNHLFMGIRPFWGVEPGPLRLSVIESNCRRFLRTFISIARGKPNRYVRPEFGYNSMNSDLIRLRMNGSLNLDGEILTSSPAQGPVTISASEPVTFIRL